MAKSKSKSKAKAKGSSKRKAPAKSITKAKTTRRAAPTAKARTAGKRPALKLPAFDPAALPAQVGSGYPKPFCDPVAGRAKRRLGDVVGLTQFGVNLVTLPPGCQSSMRHWHKNEDELVFVVSGELVLATDEGEQVLTPGMAAGFPAGKPNGHHLINRTRRNATYLEVGTRWPGGDEADYSDVDMLMRVIDGDERFVRKDGTPY